MSIKAEAIDLYSSVANDVKNISIAAHVFGDIRPTIPLYQIEACYISHCLLTKLTGQNEKLAV